MGTCVSVSTTSDLPPHHAIACRLHGGNSCLFEWRRAIPYRYVAAMFASPPGCVFLCFPTFELQELHARGVPEVRNCKRLTPVARNEPECLLKWRCICDCCQPNTVAILCRDNQQASLRLDRRVHDASPILQHPSICAFALHTKQHTEHSSQSRT